MKRFMVVLACSACATPSPEPRAERQQAAKPSAARAAAEHWAKHIERLRERLTDKGLGDMEIGVEEPFVVVGDGSAESLARDAQTVRWAADILEQDFFTKRPTKTLDVFLFSNADSYERGVKQLTGDEPGTPYGFYSRAHRGLFMNIATGGGTLVHEIVHPYVEADFPNAPPWLNEGLGSLFEQSAERNGHIVGLTNWRLRGLQQAIALDAVPSFAQLTRLDDDAFYGEGSGVHYAAARYLLYYLQEHGKLREFYRAFRAAAAQDPTGYRTLVATLGVDDMDAFERRWQLYVTKLRYQ